MSVMFEVFYKAPADTSFENGIAKTVESLRGRLDFREPAEWLGGPIVLTFEFDDWVSAEQAVSTLRAQGIHVEGPQDYGD
jgi:hypothetical protein